MYSFFILFIVFTISCELEKRVVAQFWIRKAEVYG
jgi:hypothetical protein